MTTIEVVPFVAKHHAAVRSLAAEILCQEFGVQDDLDNEHDLLDIAASYAAPGSRFLVALQDGQLVGTGGILRLSEHDCELRRLYVDAKRRRQGVASEIVGELLKFVRERGYNRVLLEIRPEMRKDKRVFSRYGFMDVPHDGAQPRSGEFMAIQLRP